LRRVGLAEGDHAPEAEAAVTRHPGLGSVPEYARPAAATLDALNSGKAVVYSAAGDKLKNITGVYGTTSQLHLRGEMPRRVDVANDLLAYLLGKSWYPRDGTHRWMPKQATVRLGGPA